MITVCAWNRPEDGPHDPDRVLSDDGIDDGRISHGICFGHRDAMLGKLKAMPTANEEIKA